MTDQSICGQCGNPKGSCDPGTKWPDGGECAWASASDLIVIPRAKAEKLRQRLADRALYTGETADHSLLTDADALLAAAKPVVDAGHVRPHHDGRFMGACPKSTVTGKVCRVLLIAADADEGGES